MADFFAQKNLGSLRPVDDEGFEALRKITNNKIIKVSIKQPRNIQHHRLFWALASLVYQNQEYYGSVEELVAVLKVATGHCTFLETSAGRAAIPKSIAFHKMDQTEFNTFFDRCVDVVCMRFLPNTDKQDLKDEVLAMVGANATARAEMKL